jgi:NADPH:quinone reductase-like Zn-dependent oxidoreductase
MKAARIHEYGHSDRIKIEDVAMPRASPDEVLVRIDAAGVNPVDWKIREGMLARRTQRHLPFTLGQDFAGQVIAVGEDVTEFDEDDEVYGFAPGTYAEYAVVAPDMIANKPAFVDDVVAAALPTPGLTALQTVREVAPLRDQTILIHGAAGGVGSIATQLVLATGARVIAVGPCSKRVAAFPALAPGDYIACIDRKLCSPLFVDPTRAQQKLENPR